MEILYEDNHIIIVNKASGEIVQGDKTGDKPLVEILKDYIKSRDNKPGNVFMGVVHRLDRPVSGWWCSLKPLRRFRGSTPCLPRATCIKPIGQFRATNLPSLRRH